MHVCMSSSWYLSVLKLLAPNTQQLKEKREKVVSSSLLLHLCFSSPSIQPKPWVCPSTPQIREVSSISLIPSVLFFLATRLVVLLLLLITLIH